MSSFNKPERNAACRIETLIQSWTPREFYPTDCETVASQSSAGARRRNTAKPVLENGRVSRNSIATPPKSCPSRPDSPMSGYSPSSSSRGRAMKRRCSLPARPQLEGSRGTPRSGAPRADTPSCRSCVTEFQQETLGDDVNYWGCSTDSPSTCHAVTPRRRAGSCCHSTRSNMAYSDVGARQSHYAPNRGTRGYNGSRTEDTRSRPHSQSASRPLSGRNRSHSAPYESQRQPTHSRAYPAHVSGYQTADGLHSKLRSRRYNPPCNGHIDPPCNSGRSKRGDPCQHIAHRSRAHSASVPHDGRICSKVPPIDMSGMRCTARDGHMRSASATGCIHCEVVRNSGKMTIAAERTQPGGVRGVVGHSENFTDDSSDVGTCCSSPAHRQRRQRTTDPLWPELPSRKAGRSLRAPSIDPRDDLNGNADLESDTVSLLSTIIDRPTNSRPTTPVSSVMRDAYHCSVSDCAVTDVDEWGSRFGLRRRHGGPVSNPCSPVHSTGAYNSRRFSTSDVGHVNRPVVNVDRAPAGTNGIRWNGTAVYEARPTTPGLGADLSSTGFPARDTVGTQSRTEDSGYRMGTSIASGAGRDWASYIQTGKDSGSDRTGVSSSDASSAARLTGVQLGGWTQTGIRAGRLGTGIGIDTFSGTSTLRSGAGLDWSSTGTSATDTAIYRTTSPTYHSGSERPLIAGVASVGAVDSPTLSGIGRTTTERNNDRRKNETPITDWTGDRPGTNKISLGNGDRTAHRNSADWTGDGSSGSSCFCISTVSSNSSSRSSGGITDLTNSAADWAGSLSGSGQKSGTAGWNQTLHTIGAEIARLKEERKQLGQPTRPSLVQQLHDLRARIIDLERQQQ